MDLISKVSCIKFSKFNGNKDFVYIEEGGQTGSDVGRRGNKQTITYSKFSNILI